MKAIYDLRNKKYAKLFEARNVMSTDRMAVCIEGHHRMNFDFDLQLFGGGGGGGKSTGKMLFTVAGFFLGGGFWTALGASSWLGGAVLGACLFSTIWSATHRPDAPDQGSLSIQRFDTTQETMSNTASIPVVYGRRLLSGNQTYHKTNADATTLHKHVVLCEGGIKGISALTANDLLIPTNGQTNNAVFTIQNLKYGDAYVWFRDRKIGFSWNGQHKEVRVYSKDELQSDADIVAWEYQVSINSLVSYINRIGDGWECFPTASTNSYPGDLRIQSPNDQYRCYMNPVNFEADTVTGGTEYTFHDCEPPSNYDEVGGYPNMAWLDMTFYASSELNGNPSVACVVEGKKVLDTRTGLVEYTTNPAMCVRDFLVSKRYGLGRWVTEDDLDEDSFKIAANYCDEIINFHNSDNVMVKAKRYELNIVIDQRQDALTWLQDILGNFSAFLVYSQGKLKLMVESPTPVRYAFDDSNMSDLKVAPLKLSETPNRYAISIIDPLNNWKVIKCIVEDHADQKMRGRIIEKEVELSGVTSQSQGLRLARFYRDYNLSCPLQVTFTAGIEAMHLEPGDVVTLKYREVFDGMPIRIAEIKETEKNTFEISGRQYNESLYSDELGGGVQWHNYSTATGIYVSGGGNYAGTPSRIEDVVAYTNADNELLIEHDASTDRYFKEYRYYVEEIKI